MCLYCIARRDLQAVTAFHTGDFSICFVNLYRASGCAARQRTRLLRPCKLRLQGLEPLDAHRQLYDLNCLKHVVTQLLGDTRRWRELEVFHVCAGTMCEYRALVTQHLGTL